MLTERILRSQLLKEEILICIEDGKMLYKGRQVDTEIEKLEKIKEKETEEIEKSSATISGDEMEQTRAERIEKDIDGTNKNLKILNLARLDTSKLKLSESMMIDENRKEKDIPEISKEKLKNDNTNVFLNIVVIKIRLDELLDVVKRKPHKNEHVDRVSFPA